ncbi:glycosyltransferase [Desulfosarcina sp. BuS5]|uniref:glycosyltransferase n=1 Tax=Desulfosarcina sp. BuS5 TaxID=933262 RepID=UPI0018DD078F|nr:glycosyltransferase [Desulfosarcina sp. BuS5]
MIDSAPRMRNSVQFSIIIPAYNSEDFIENCLYSALNQSLKRGNFEVILVDDCSTDSTFLIASRLATNNKNLFVTKTPKNSGPGIARNVGLSKATGKWVIFVDSDDYLHREALSKLQVFLDMNNSAFLDAVGFNWEYDSARFSSEQFQVSGRRDHSSLELSKNQLIKKYLSLHMDGSVIYTAIRRKLIIENNLQFATGYHEDVDYIFKVYWYARKVCYLDEVLYFKWQRPNSIVNTVSVQHIEGFMRAWKEIGAFVVTNDPDGWQEFFLYYKLGLSGAVATRVREIYRHNSSNKRAIELYAALYRCWIDYFVSIEDFFELPTKKTKYILIASHFLKTMQDERLTAKLKAIAISEYIKQVVNKSWSCIDLHHSIFLAPDQIRTCCKRFFVDGEMHGDVILLDMSKCDSARVSSQNILEAKQKLFSKINSGEKSDCDGCPFLEFKEWGSLRNLEIKYLSFEHHSICNLRCSYCSETYYGGKKPRYDVKALIESFLNQNVLDSYSVVVWGGGEPVLDKGFAPLIEKLADQLPGANQRVLTNAVIYSETIEHLLAEDKVSITSSIDAGTDETYLLVRGQSKLREALANLEKYASANSAKVTIKYIFTEENSSIEEVKSFIPFMKNFNLIGCNYQISTDFKKEIVSIDEAILMIAMYGLLTDAGCRLVYFDDLLRQRLGKIHSHSENLIKSKIVDMGIGHVLADKASYKSVAIWGAGWQAKYLLEKTSFFKHVDVEFFVDSTTSKIGGQFLDHNIFAPTALLDSDIPIVIAAVQGFPIIFDAFLALGIDESRLIKKLIL